MSKVVITSKNKVFLMERWWDVVEKKSNNDFKEVEKVKINMRER